MLSERRALENDADTEALLEVALQQLRLPRRFGVILEGSVAEGFGNRTSDVDFLVITEEDQRSAKIPTVLFVDGRRVEIRVRSRAQVLEHAARIHAVDVTSAAAVGALSHDDLDIYQRCQRARIVRHRHVIEPVKAAHDNERFVAVVAAWQALRARRAMRRAWLLQALGEPRTAAQWCRSALVAAAKCWAARRGETYLSDKWLDEQLERAQMPASLRQRLWAFMSHAGDDQARYLDDCLEYVRGLDVAVGAPLGLDDLTLAPRAGVTSWQLGDQLCVLRDKEELFVLGERMALVWRSLVFATPLSRVVAGIGLDGDQSVRLVATLHRAGLVGLRWPDGDDWTPGGGFPALAFAGSFISSRGLRCPVAADDVVLLGAPAPTLCFAGCELVWASVCVENGWEDFHGAIERGQWRAAQAALQSVVAWACQICWSSFGLHPPPERWEIATRLRELPIDPALAGEAEALRYIDVADGEQARAAQQRVERFVAAVRRHSGDGDAPSSFANAAEWTRTLEIAFDWIRMAAFIDDSLDPAGRTFPVEELREFVGARSGGGVGVATRGGKGSGVLGRRAFAGAAPRQGAV